MFIPLVNCFPNRFFRILRFPALIFISLLFVLMSNTVAYSRLATFSLNPNTESYPAGYRVYILDNDGDYTFIGIVEFGKCKLENNIVTFDFDLGVICSGETYYYSLTAFNDGQESPFSNVYRLDVPLDSDGDSLDSDRDSTDSDGDSLDSDRDSTDSDGDSLDSDRDSLDSDGDSLDSDGDSTDSDKDGVPDHIEIIIGTDPQDPDSDDDGICDGLELKLGKNPLCPDATVEYSVQVTLDPELHSSIPDPRGYDVFYDTVSLWDGDCDDYQFSQEVGIVDCRLDGEFVKCDLKIEFKPGGTYFLSVKAFDNLYESAYFNEMSFTLPKDADFDGIPDMGEDVCGTNPYNPDSDNDGILDGRELELGTDPLHNDLLAEYLVQVTVDPAAISISDPARCEVLLSSIGWLDGGFDNYELSKEVDIDACWFEEECMICDIMLELLPGGNYVISTRIFGNNNESVISNEIPFTLPNIL